MLSILRSTQIYKERRRRGRVKGRVRGRKGMRGKEGES